MRSIIRITVVGIVGMWSIVGASLAGCSAANTDASGDGGIGGDGAVSQGDGATGDGGGGGGDGSTTTNGINSVILVTGGGPRFSMTAAFRGMPAPVPAGCVTKTVGGCIATSCPAVDGILSSSLNAGAITVAGTGPDSPVTIRYTAMGDAGLMGYSARGNSQFFHGGDTITASGAGGPDVPAFAAQTVIAPNEIVVTSPACAAIKCPDIPRSHDATIAWTGGGAGKVEITYITDTDDGSKTLSCSFDASAGSGTIPSAALMMLDPGTAPGFYGLAIVYPMSTKTIMVGTLPTLLAAQGGATEGSFTFTD